MKQATLYAKRVRTFHNRLRRRYGRPDPPAPTPPMDQLVTGILQGGTTVARASAALQRIRDRMVDYNELRVSPQYEIVELVGDLVPDPAEKAARISAALKWLFGKEHVVDLPKLAGLPGKESRAYLDEIAGLDAYTRSSILLLSLDCPAIPVDDDVLAMLRDEEVVHEKADTEDVQAFLDRYIPAADAVSFYQLCQQHVSERPPPPTDKETKNKKKKKKTSALGSRTSKTQKAQGPVAETCETPEAKKTDGAAEEKGVEGPATDRESTEDPKS